MLSKIFVPAWRGFSFIKTPMMLVSYADVAASLWHTPEGDAYATMESESLLLTSREFQ